MGIAYTQHLIPGQNHLTCVFQPILRVSFRHLEEDGVVVRIIEKQGSAPRSVGSMMFVTESSTYSTVGGGRIESLAIEEARKLLKSGEEKKIVSYDLGKGGNAGMICGGSVKLLLTRKR